MAKRGRKPTATGRDAPCPRVSQADADWLAARLPESQAAHRATALELAKKHRALEEAHKTIERLNGRVTALGGRITPRGMADRKLAEWRPEDP